MISILSIVHDTMVDGPGFRTSIYCAGCPNHCPECHNPQSWDIKNGTMTSTADIMKEIMSDPFANVTFSGGDPMFQAEGFTELAKAIRKESDKNIWCFTGYKYENLLKNPKQLALLQQIDVLVDGPFIKDLRNEELFFRGSSNQRIINVRKSLEKGEIVELIFTKTTQPHNSDRHITQYHCLLKNLHRKHPTQPSIFSRNRVASHSNGSACRCKAASLHQQPPSL